MGAIPSFGSIALRTRHSLRGHSSRVEPERATLEIRVRFPVTAPAREPPAVHRKRCRREARSASFAVFLGEEGVPHKPGRDSSTLSTATSLGIFSRFVPEYSNGRIRGLEPLGCGFESRLRIFRCLVKSAPRFPSRSPSSGDDTCPTHRNRRVRSSRSAPWVRIPCSDSCERRRVVRKAGWPSPLDVRRRLRHA